MFKGKHKSFTHPLILLLSVLKSLTISLTTLNGMYYGNLRVMPRSQIKTGNDWQVKRDANNLACIVLVCVERLEAKM